MLCTVSIGSRGNIAAVLFLFLFSITPRRIKDLVIGTYVSVKEDEGEKEGEELSEVVHYKVTQCHTICIYSYFLTNRNHKPVTQIIVIKQ